MDLDGEKEQSPAPSSPSAATPGAFPEQDSHMNGVNGTTHEDAPAPPPHKSPSSPPPPEAPTVDAEACKAAGNKFFKAREWQKAIQEYTKGCSDPILSAGRHMASHVMQVMRTETRTHLYNVD